MISWEYHKTFKDYFSCYFEKKTLLWYFPWYLKNVSKTFSHDNPMLSCVTITSDCSLLNYQILSEKHFLVFSMIHGHENDRASILCDRDTDSNTHRFLLLHCTNWNSMKCSTHKFELKISLLTSSNLFF